MAFGVYGDCPESANRYAKFREAEEQRKKELNECLNETLVELAKTVQITRDRPSPEPTKAEFPVGEGMKERTEILTVTLDKYVEKIRSGFSNPESTAVELTAKKDASSQTEYLNKEFA